MSVIFLLIVFAMGWTSDSFRSGSMIVVPIGALLTFLCLVTTNNPAFTDIERSLSFSLESIGLNFLVKLSFLWLAYAAGIAAQVAVARLASWKTAEIVTSNSRDPAARG